MTVLTSVGPEDVVWLLGCQEVEFDANVSEDQEVPPECQVLHLLGGDTGALEVVGAEHCALETAIAMVPLDHNVGNVLESTSHCLQSLLLHAATLGQ